MDRNRVADVLEEIALLLELKGENPFESRAYRGAAATIRALDRDLTDLARTGGLTVLPGVGGALAEKITTLVLTGSLPYLEALRSDARFGVGVARRAGLTAAHILITAPAGRLDEALARRR